MAGIDAKRLKNLTCVDETFCPMIMVTKLCMPYGEVSQYLLNLNLSKGLLIELSVSSYNMIMTIRKSYMVNIQLNSQFLGPKGHIFILLFLFLSYFLLKLCTR